MKCPKCGYISFDYNQMCPKCNKAISNERDILNLPGYKPDTPSLLGALTGEADDSHPDLRLEAAGGPENLGAEETGFTAEDSQAIEAMEEAFRDGQSFDVSESIEFSEISGDTGSGPGELGAADLEELALEEDAIGDDFILEPDTPSSGASRSRPAAPEPSVVDEEAISLDLEDLAGGDLSARLGEGGGEQTGKDAGLELEDLASLLDDEDADVQSPSAKEKPKQKADAPLDLEDLDLELELEEPDQKSS